MTNYSVAFFSNSPIPLREASPVRPAAVSQAPVDGTINKLAEEALAKMQAPVSPRTPSKVPAAAMPCTPPPKSPAYLSMSSDASPPPKAPQKGAAYLAMSSDDSPPPKAPPKSRKKSDLPVNTSSVKETPVRKFILHANELSPDHSAMPVTQKLQNSAVESAANRPSPDRHEALERLDNCARKAMLRSRILKFEIASEKVTGVVGWKEFLPCWPADVFQKVNRFVKPSRDPSRVLLNLTHLDNLELTEGGQSVKGKHIHDRYLPGAWVNRKTQVWCALQKVDLSAKEAKFSTFFPLLRCSHQEIIDLATQALKDPVIARKDGLFLVQPQGCDFCVEIAMRNNVISTVIPILGYTVYDKNAVFHFDNYRDETLHPAHPIALQKVLPHIRARIKADSTEIRYQCENGDLIIDIAYFLNEAGYADCPIQKGILVRFPRREVLK